MKFLLALSLKVKIIIISCVVTAAAVTTAVVIINSEDAYRVIKVFELQGEAFVSRENTGELEAYEGMNLESGDVLHVGDSSFMRLSLDNDKYILLDSGTVLELIAEGSSSDSRTVVNLKEGTILNEITNALSANSSYEVNTPKATMAVRGTSFKVTVTKTDEGGYVTDIDTVHGKVLVRLYDENGNLKTVEALVTEGNRATILTDPNSETGNAPELDGNAYFVFRKSGDTFIPCGEADPVYASDYSTFSEIVRSVALNSNDSELLLLDKEIADKLRGIGTGSAEANTSAASSETTETETHSETSPSLTESSETETHAETSVTSSVSYAVTAAALPVSDIPEVTTVPTETTEQTTVIPSEQTSAAETEPPITETSQTTTTRMTDTEKRTEETTAASAATRIIIPSETAPHTYTPPYIPTATTPIPEYTETTTVPETTTESTSVPEYTETVTESETTTESASVSEDTETVTESETTTESASVSEDTETVTESETTTESTSVSEDTETTTESETTTEPPPAVYNVSFIDGDGNTVLTSTVEDGGKIEALPEITEKRGYTAKWVSGGAEVTTDTVIGADMQITAEYTPKPVTVQISAPHSGDPQNTYDTVLEFTIPYDGTITDSAEGYNIENLTEYVMNLYADYLNEHGGTIELEYIHSNSQVGDDVVTDDYIFTGDHVFENGDELSAYVGFQLSYTR